MRTVLLTATVVSLLAATATAAVAQAPAVPARDVGPDHHITFAPEDVHWRDGPASLPAGSQVAVLEGDPSASGVFTLRLRLPDGYVIPPHWHPAVERVTVLEGTFRLGAGDRVDRAATTPLLPGTYTSMPPGMRHFAIAEGETVIQLTSVGPWELNYVNPADDPRRER